MSDLIERQAVLDIWHTSYSDNREENEEIQYKKIAFELPPVNPQSNTDWIPVSERLPKEYIACLCTIRNHETFNNRLEVYNHVIQYDPGSKEWLDEDMSRLDYEVIAWMPKPEPFKMSEIQTGSEREVRNEKETC